MKRYNLSEIMKNAHRSYKYSGKQQGKTFGEVLKATWKLAKYNDLSIPSSAYYNPNSTGRYGAHYVGD